MRAAGWEFSDAWVLAAVLSNADSCTLGELVAAGDGINHAILLADEVESAVGKLLGAGLVVVRDRRFSATDAARALPRRGGLIGQVDSLLAALRRLPVTPQPWSLEPGELEAAVRWWRTEAGRIGAG